MNRWRVESGLLTLVDLTLQCPCESGITLTLSSSRYWWMVWTIFMTQIWRVKLECSLASNICGSKEGKEGGRNAVDGREERKYGKEKED